jgi:hypothetical protein
MRREWLGCLAFDVRYSLFLVGYSFRLRAGMEYRISNKDFRRLKVEEGFDVTAGYHHALAFSSVIRSLRCGSGMGRVGLE